MKTHKQTPARKGGQRFDWYPVLDEGFINSLTTTVLKKIHQSQSTRGITKVQAESRTNDQQAIITHLLSGLYFAHTVITSESNNTYISIPRDTGLYSKAQRKTNKMPYPYRPLATVYDCLEALGWIHIIPGKEGTGFTRVYAGGKLAEIFNMIGLRWVKQTPNSQDKLIVLRDKDMSRPLPCRPFRKQKYPKITLDTPETPETLRMAENLYRYNEFITQHCIAFDLPDSALVTIAKAMAGNEDKYKLKHIDFSMVQLRRIFSRGDMSLHGRFYGGWWQSINSKDWEYRTHITIDGHRTCEVDYSSVCLRIVYALKGISIDPEEDLYDIGLPGKYSRSKRDLVKEYINAIMNDEEETFSLEKVQLRQLGLTHEELQTLVLKRHKPISEELIAGIGLKTQFIDSQIAEDIMLTMVDKGILVLPIHDSFIVKDKHQRLLETVMLESFKKYTGHPGSLDTTLPRLPCHFGYSKEHYKNLFDSLKVDSSLPLVNLGGPEKTQDNGTLMSSYMISWRDYSRNTPLCHLDHLY
tara:strand:- start:1492 stop:3069 length:1578 start_codon:yes stop_codon:yes gene_type:complete